MRYVKRWYFTTSLEGSASLSDQIRGAVISARRYTDLQPVCLCEGLVPEMESFLRSQEVEIHEMHVPFVNRMGQALAGWEGFSPNMAKGTYLKLYVPLFEQNDEHVLYTDIDVMFQKQPIFPPWEIRYLGACPEAQIDNWNYFNCGVMIFNVPNMRKIIPSINEFIEMRMQHKIFCAYEQGDLNGFLWMRWTHLGIGMNWKPYWGVNTEAPIIHFHGPKVKDFYRYTGQIEGKVDANLLHFIEKNPEHYRYYAEKFEELGINA